MSMETAMDEEKMLVRASVLFLVNSDEIALGVKKSKIGSGLLNGTGGGVEPYENEYQCAVREAFEEWKIIVGVWNLEKVAMLTLHNRKSTGKVVDCLLHVFFANNWIGEPRETKEMSLPQWYSKKNIPLERMMPADRMWLPRVVAGEKLMGEVWYSPHQEDLERACDFRTPTEEELSRLFIQ